MICVGILISAKKSSTMAEETRNFLGKLERLDAILDSLINIGPALTDFLPRLRQLQQRGIEISRHVAAEESLNAGGKFEWVDSVLIKVGICCFLRSSLKASASLS